MRSVRCRWRSGWRKPASFSASTASWSISWPPPAALRFHETRSVPPGLRVDDGRFYYTVGASPTAAWRGALLPFAVLRRAGAVAAVTAESFAHVLVSASGARGDAALAGLCELAASFAQLAGGATALERRTATARVLALVLSHATGGGAGPGARAGADAPSFERALRELGQWEFEAGEEAALYRAFARFEERQREHGRARALLVHLSLIHISEPTRPY